MTQPRADEVRGKITDVIAASERVRAAARSAADQIAADRAAAQPAPSTPVNEAG